jgi:hypothetical protein
LRPLPPSFVTTRGSLHRVAELVVAPARKPDNEIALEPTPGGFGTPWFSYGGAEHRVRVEGEELVHEIGGEAQHAPLGSLAVARKVVGELLPQDAELDDTPLELDGAASAALADWYGFGRAALEALVAEAKPEDDPSPPILWPEHFDIAVELGPEHRGARATYGFSPGDEAHAEPYAYVAPWADDVEGPLWRARGFRGAELGYAELVAADDQLGAAVAFLRARKDALAA